MSQSDETRCVAKMPTGYYRIKGPVPTRCIGDCPWCNKKNGVLHLLAATIDGELTGMYVCARCLLSLDDMRDKLGYGLGDNPDVEVQG